MVQPPTKSSSRYRLPAHSTARLMEAQSLAAVDRCQYSLRFRSRAGHRTFQWQRAPRFGSAPISRMELESLALLLQRWANIAAILDKPVQTHLPKPMALPERP